jgi:hypothetical protein
MSRVTSVQDGEELRGYVVKLYPNQEQLRYLGRAQEELMAAWNVLVTSRETHIDHCVRHCEDAGLIGPVPPRPSRDKDAENVTEWAEYARACGERRFVAVSLTRKTPGLEWADWRVDYKTLRDLFGGRDSHASAQMFLSLVETFRKTKGPRRKKLPEDMPLLNRTGGHAIRFADSPTTRTTPSGRQTRLTSSHRCVVSFGPLKIKAGFHQPPPGPFIEGIAIKLAQNGWYASAKCRVVPAAIPAGHKEIIAVNAGLECLYADNEGHVIENPRGNAYSLEIRRLDGLIEAASDSHERVTLRNRRGRYQERMARRVEHLIYNQILPRLAAYDTILLDTTGKRAAQGPQNRISKNDEGGYVSAMSLMHQLIVQRFGAYHEDDNPTGRVRVVQSVGISRRCSQCGTEHATRYQRSNLRRHDQITDCQTPSCRLHIHVDVNAARNLLAKYLELQHAAE